MRKRSPVSSPLCQARPLGEYGEPENPQMDLGIKEQGPDPSPTQLSFPGGAQDRQRSGTSRQVAAGAVQAETRR